MLPSPAGKCSYIKEERVMEEVTSICKDPITTYKEEIK
jgi:hypothetical protein